MSRSMRNVDLNLLSIFVALMHDQNLSHTAEHLGMTQPAVSQALKRLRTLYNDPLFERKAGKMMPTFKAQAIFPSVKKILDDVIATLPEQQNFKPENAKQTFHINLLGLHHDFFVTNLMKEISQIAPDVSLTISSIQVDDVEKALLNREFDVHIDYLPTLTSGCHTQVLFEDELNIMARKEHPRLGGLQHVNLEQYLAEFHAVFTPRTDNKFVLGTALVDNIDLKYERKVRYKSGSALNIVETVCATDLICVMAKGVIETTYLKDDLLYFKLPFPTQTISGFMTWHWATEHYQSHRWLRKLIMKHCQRFNSTREN